MTASLLDIPSSVGYADTFSRWEKETNFTKRSMFADSRRLCNTENIMRHQLTPAAQRALLSAARWSHDPSGERIRYGHLLLGLLAEPETRAAVLLGQRQISTTAVLARWPQADPAPPEAPSIDTLPERFSAELDTVLAAADEWLGDLPRPHTLATEHLLLGLLSAGREVAEWLREQGLDVECVAAQLQRLRGESLAGVPIDLPPDSWATAPRSPSAATVSSPAQPAWRIIDAASNRAREGLRVVEDFVRFALDDPHLTERWKQLRHDLTAALTRLGDADPLAMRDTPGDVGTRITTQSEQRRADLAAVFAANVARLQESLRSLEEFGKLVDPRFAAECEQLRYRTYTLERATLNTLRRGVELQDARLYVLIDGAPDEASFRSRVETLIGAGVDVLQLRDKQLADRTLLARAQVLRQLTRGTATRFVMNDRADLAALAAADGVHLGQDELTVAEARRIVGPRMLIGVSTHSLEQARAAVLDGADYIGVGPTFPSHTKRFEQFPGVELLRQVSAEIRLPAFAIGGITLDNLPQVLATGVTRVAVAGAMVAAEEPARVARLFRERLSRVE